MAITLTTTPDNDVAAFAPVILAGTTTRNPFTSGTRQSTTMNTASNSGGRPSIIVTSSASFLVGDTVVIENSTNYTGRFSIYSIPDSTHIVLDTAYVDTTSGGTMYRMNEGLCVMVEVENVSAEVIATLYANVNTSTSAFSLDISKALQYELSGNLDLSGGEIDTDTFSHEYTLTIYEVWLGDDYTQTSSMYGSSPTVIGHRTVELVEDFINGDTLMTGDFFHNGAIPVHFFMDAGGASIQLKFTEADGTVTNSGALTATNMHYYYTFLSDSEWVKVAVWDVTEGTRISDDIYVRKIGCNSTLIWFVNRYGAYEAIEVREYEDDQKTIKVNKYTGEAWKERTLYLKEYTNGVYQDIRDLITSPEVYDEDLTEVRVLTDSLNYRASEVSPEITIRYDETYLQ